jgi:hypothetical protein
MSRWAKWALIGGCGLASSSAQAANGLHPRTVVVWDDHGGCEVVVRSQQSSINLEYSLPDVNEDGMLDECDDDPTPSHCDPAFNTEPGEDEVSDSRRHQFFATCRQRPRNQLLPNWISDDDVQASAQVETCCEIDMMTMTCVDGEMCPLVDPATLSADDVVETNDTWKECIVPINGAGDRLPITVANANAGIDWDTTDVAPGVYQIEGYTWEPPFNVWKTRPGFVKVVDAPEDADLYPGVAITQLDDADLGDGIIDGCEAITISGCVDAGDGAFLDVFWSASQAGVPNAWHRIVENEPVMGSSFEIQWEPDALPDGPVLFRVDVKHECGTYTAHGPRALEVLAGDECDDGAVFQDGGDEGGDEFIDDQDNRDNQICAAEPDDPRCGCRGTDPRAGLPLLALLALLWPRRSRRILH